MPFQRFTLVVNNVYKMVHGVQVKLAPMVVVRFTTAAVLSQRIVTALFSVSPIAIVVSVMKCRSVPTNSQVTIGASLRLVVMVVMALASVSALITVSLANTIVVAMIVIFVPIITMPMVAEPKSILVAMVVTMAELIRRTVSVLVVKCLERTIAPVAPVIIVRSIARAVQVAIVPTLVLVAVKVLVIVNVPMVARPTMMVSFAVEHQPSTLAPNSDCKMERGVQKQVVPMVAGRITQATA